MVQALNDRSSGVTLAHGVGRAGRLMVGFSHMVMPSSSDPWAASRSKNQSLASADEERVCAQGHRVAARGRACGICNP